jgi:protein-disulfide isomerase
MRPLVLTGLLGTVLLTGCGEGDARTAGAAQATPPTPDAAVAPTADPRVERADQSRIMGIPTANTWMLIVSDFQCPYCKDFHDKRAAALKKEFVETGKVRFAYVHCPLSQHPNAVPAAEASMCAGAQDRFWPYHDRLFDTVDEWGPSPSPQAVFDSIATGIGLDLTAFHQCLQDDVMLPIIQVDYQRGVDAKVRSTPTFLVGSVMIPGVAPLDVFRKEINNALAGGTK